MTATYRPTPQVPALDGMTPLGVSPQKTLEERVLEWTEGLCDSLTENYKQHSIRMYQVGDSDYSRKQLESVENGTWKGTKFVIKNGRKYYKIMQHEYDTYRDINEYRESSVHAFVDKKTGEVYKPASYNSPAKHVRFEIGRASCRERV